MNNENLLRKAAELGFQADRTSHQYDPNKTLAEVVQSHDQRLWEAFPVMLASAAQAGEFNFEAANACLAEEERKYLKLLVIVALGLYDSLGLDVPRRKRLSEGFPARLIANFSAKLEVNAPLELGRLSLLPGKLKENFLEYRKKSAVLAENTAKTREEAGLEAAISRIFTARQKGLLIKRLNREPMTKTEKEYFSRVIKKKAQALANESLHRLAKRLLE